MENTTIYLCKADSSILGTLTGIQAQTCTLIRNATDLWELRFDVNRYLDADGKLVQSDYYDSIDDMMRLYLDSADLQVFFVIDSEPVIKGDGYQETKTVTAHSVECELCHMYLKNLKINCGTPDSQEYLACETDNEGNNVFYNVNPYTNLPHEYISLVNYGDPQLSLLHLALQGTGWTVREGMDMDGYLEETHYFRTVINTVKDPSGRSPERVTGHVKKKCTAGKKVYAVELQKWGSSGIGFTIEHTADLTIVAQSAHNTVRIHEQNNNAATTFVSLPAPIALTDTDNRFYENTQKLREVRHHSEDENGIVLIYKNLTPGTYRIISPYQSITTDCQNSVICDYGVQIKSVTVSEHIDGTREKKTHIFRASDLSADADNEEILSMCQIKKCFETSDSVYSFLMKTVSPAASVIFEFDRKHKVVGIVKAADYGEDTGVFLSMRNLMNSFEVTSTSNDSIITKLVPTGANNLDIAYVNFGKDYILNLDYFMNTLNEYGDYKFVSSKLHDKYTAWKHYREAEPFSVCPTHGTGSCTCSTRIRGTRREVYTELTKRYHQTISAISELKNRVPNDGCMIDYKTYKPDELKAAYTAYRNALLTLITLYKNEYGVETIGDAPNYIPTPQSAQNIKNTPYWHDFYAYQEAIIPQVEEALKQYCQTDENGHLVFDQEGSLIELEFGNPDYYANERIVKTVDAYLYEWSLYGLDELEAKKKAWCEAANLLFEDCFIVSGTASSPIQYRTADHNGWTSLNSKQKSKFTSMSAYVTKLNQYLDYMAFTERENALTNTKCKGIIRQCEDAIAKRTAAIDELQKEQTIYYRLRKELADSAALNEQFRLNANANTLFTKNDMDVINGIIREQDFNNENIFTTNLDVLVTTVSVQEELYQSAAAKLYELSQPQYAFRTELDNLYALDAFKAFQKPFDIGNFIRVGLETHEDICENHFMKMRLISITHNPLLADEQLSVTFSTLTRSLNGINDLAFLLGDETSGGGTSASSSGGGTYGSNDPNVQISNNMLNALLSTELFGTAVSDVILDTLSANKGHFKDLFSASGAFDALEAGKIKVKGDCLFDGAIQSGNFTPPNNAASGLGSRFNLTDGTFESYASNGNYMKNDGDNLIIKMSNFQIDNKGNAEFKGNVSGSNGFFMGDLIGSGSISTIPGYYVPDDWFINIYVSIEKINGVSADLAVEYYHATPNGLEKAQIICEDVQSWHRPLDEPNDFFDDVIQLKGSEINAWNSGRIGIHNIDVIPEHGDIVLNKLEVINASGKIVDCYYGSEINNTNKISIDTTAGLISGSKLSINTETGLISGDKLSIDTASGLISGGIYTGTINIANKFSVNDVGKVECLDLNIAGGKFTHQLKQHNETESIWKDQEGNQYYRTLIMDASGLSIKTNRDDEGSYDSANLLFKDRQFSLYNDTDGEITLNFSGYYNDNQGAIPYPSSDRTIITKPIMPKDNYINNIIDVHGMHGEIGYSELLDETSNFYRISIFAHWNYGEYLACTGAYEQQSFSGLSKRTLYVGSDGTISAASSSRRYKQDISSELDAYFNPHLIYDLPVCQFRYNAKNGGGNDSQLYIGFIAEDIAKYYPAAARWNKEHTEVDTWEMSDLFPAVVKLVQEQHKEIETLKEQFKKLQHLIKEDLTNGNN